MKGKAAILAAVALAACGSPAPERKVPKRTGPPLVDVTISGPGGSHLFHVEQARTAEAQAKGLMFRTDLAADGGMLFAPYPPDGPPRVANFWMKDTPKPLDIVFIRADRTIVRIAENTAPMSESIVSSGEPVAAVLEINGGRAAELGIAEGDRVRWTGP